MLKRISEKYIADSPGSLHQTMDAKVWAKEFIKVYGTTNPVSEETIFIWFANSIMTGYDHATWKYENKIIELKDEIETLKFKISFESKLNE